MTNWIKTVLGFCSVLSVIVTSTPSPAFACSCAYERSIKEELKTSEEVFAGKVLGIKEERELSIEFSPTTFLPSHKSVLFEVTKSFKGVTQSQILIKTMLHEAACGYDFQVGKEYLVYANELRPEFLETNICDRTKS
jgi:hypothetical protein